VVKSASEKVVRARAGGAVGVVKREEELAERGGKDVSSRSLHHLSTRLEFSGGALRY